MKDMLLQHGIGVGGDSNIKSVQRVFQKMTAISHDVPIAAVNLNTSVVKVTVISALEATNSITKNVVASAKLLNATTIRVEVGEYNATYTPPTTVLVEVIEFNNVKSLQRGTFTATVSSSQSLAITSVNSAKAILFASFRTTHHSNSFANILKGARLASDSSILFNNNYDTYYALYWEWEVIEFN